MGRPPQESPAARPPVGARGSPSGDVLRPCRISITSRTSEDRQRTPLPSRTKGAQRRRRLARGVARWDFDRRLCAEPTWRVAVVTLTVPDGDPAAVVGDVQRFLAAVRRRWLGVRYFCWLELQARGAAHYHMVWVNPPNRREVNLLHWVEHAWGRGRTQVRFSGDPNRIENEVEYAVAHSKKIGRKAYQQRYDDAPRELRTFMNQQLEIPIKEIDGHLGGQIWAYRRPDVTPSRILPGVWRAVDAYLELIGDREHVVPVGGVCRALEARRSKRSPPRSPPWKSPSSRSSASNNSPAVRRAVNRAGRGSDASA
jgi:hypothetical protein